MKDVGSNIRYLRKELRMTQEELAGDNFTKSYISLIERGKINPSMKALGHIAGKLNKPIAYLLDTSTNIVNDNNNSEIMTKIKKGHELTEKGELKLALSLFNELRNSYESYSNYYQGIIDYYVGFITYKLDNSSVAYDYLRSAIRHLKTAMKNISDVDETSIIKVYIKLGECYYLLNDINKSLSYFLLAQEKSGLNRFILEQEFYILKNIIFIYIQKANFTIAIDYLNKLIDLSRKNNIINRDVLECYISLATCYVSLDQNERAKETLQKIIPIYEHLLNDSKSIACIYYKLAELEIRDGDVEKARQFIIKSNSKAEDILEEDDKIFTLLLNKLLDAKVAFMCEDIETAYEIGHKVHGEITEINRNNPEYSRLQADIECFIGEVEMQRMELDSASYYLESAARMYTRINSSYRLPNVYKLLGTLALKNNDNVLAQKYYNKAFSNYSSNFKTS